jgi:hypothetical protein
MNLPIGIIIKASKQPLHSSLSSPPAFPTLPAYPHSTSNYYPAEEKIYIAK